MTPEEFANLPAEELVKLRLIHSFPYFAKNTLKIITKSGDVLPFKINSGQKKLHDFLEDQKKRKGKVRTIVVKGRQMGASTYIEGRFYHNLWKSQKALKAFIMTHSDKSTGYLFSMTRNFHDYQSDDIKPPLTTGNAKELSFAHNKCSYEVATAGSKEVGRGTTIQMFHGSEVAFWPSADNHMAASLQAVSNSEGTELILESTANGIGNMFHRMVQAALKGESDFEVCFMPWFWHEEEYREPCPKSFATECSDEWNNYGVDHNLAYDQLYWAYKKNREIAQTIGEGYDKPCWKFKQEYPATLVEAFQTSGSRSFIPSEAVLKARKSSVVGFGKRILGVDPARSGDKVGIIDRCGSRMGEIIIEAIPPGGTLTYVASQISEIIDRVKPDMVNIDTTGLGAGVYDILVERGYDRVVNAVHFGQKPLGKGPTGDSIYANRRAEMYDLMRDWFCGDTPVQIADSDELHAELCAAEWGSSGCRQNTSGALVIEEKDKIKQRLGSSPDLADAAALTFAIPIFASQSHYEERRSPKNSRTGY